MKNVHEIFKNFEESNPKKAKEYFIKRLNYYVSNKYNSLDKFASDCVDFSCDIEKYKNLEPDVIKIQTKVRKNIANWFNPLVSIKRETIIDIAFILADIQNKNGEIIANDLLNAAGYPKLHSTSEMEIFYIFSLRNGKTYLDFLDLVHEYNTLDLDIKSNATISDEAKTSTYFYHEQKDITDKNKLFCYLKSKTLDFGVGSKKISKKVSYTFDKMVQRYQSKKDLKLDFFLYYASDKTFTEFLTDFEKSGMTTAETARLAYDKYINGCCPMDFEFYPINRCSYSTVFDGLDNVISGEKTLTREGLLLWLLFYYHKDDDGNEYYFQLDDINDFIGTRFLRLNDNYYFDKYVLTILGFTLDDHKIKYNGEEISDDKLLKKIIFMN